MDYDSKNREIIFRFNSISDLLEINGNHFIKLQLTDKKGAFNEYQFIVNFKIPPRIIFKLKEPEAIIVRNTTLNATIESITDMGLMRINFNKLMHTSFNWTTLNQSNIDIWV